MAEEPSTTSQAPRQLRLSFIGVTESLKGRRRKAHLGEDFAREALCQSLAAFSESNDQRNLPVTWQRG